MKLSLLPQCLAEDVTRVKPETLVREGIRLVLLDFDNTLLPYTTDVPEKQVLQWLTDLRQAGVTVCIVSNSHKRRVPDFCAAHGIGCVTHARKPFPGGVRRALEINACQPQHAVLIGDQIYTDTLAGNLAGVQTVLVRSISNHNIWLKLRHLAEKPVISLARKRRRIL